MILTVISAVNILQIQILKIRPFLLANSREIRLVLYKCIIHTHTQILTCTYICMQKQGQELAVNYRQYSPFIYVYLGKLVCKLTILSQKTSILISCPQFLIATISFRGRIARLQKELNEVRSLPFSQNVKSLNLQGQLRIYGYQPLK